jgi:hypothetical protein
MKSDDESFLRFWEKRRKQNKWIYSLIISVFYGFIIAFVIGLVGHNMDFSFWKYDWQPAIVNFGVFTLIWFLKSIWQWNKMESRYKNLSE